MNYSKSETNRVGSWLFLMPNSTGGPQKISSVFGFAFLHAKSKALATKYIQIS